MEDKKKKFDPLAKDWLVGNVGEESVKDAIEETVEYIPNDNEVEDEVKEGKEDTVGFKNILEDTTSKNVLEEDEEEVEETKED
jgi:hypothetical protein